MLPKPVAVASSSNPVYTIGVYILMGCIFLIYSRAVDFIAVPGIALVLVVLVLLATGIVGDVKSTFKMPTTRWICLYMAWLPVTILFSIWRGGSFTIFVNHAFHAALIYVSIVSLVTTRKVMNTVVGTIALANLFICVMGFIGPTHLMQERLVIGYGTFGDPNALAMYLLFGLPCWWLWAQRLPILLRIFPIGAVCLTLMVFGKTGSRGGMIALIAVLGFHFLKVPAAMKAKLLAAVVVFGLAAAVLLPTYITLRFMSFFTIADESSPYAAMLKGNDVASTESREDVAKQAFNLTLQHPLTGVGMGNFGDSAYSAFKQHGAEFINTATHNSFLQVSSETGIPGFLLFTAMIISTLFLKSPGTRRPDLSKGGDIATWDLVTMHYMKLCVVVLCAFAISLSFAYDDILMIGLALVVASWNIANKSAAVNTNAAVAVKLAPTVVRTARPAGFKPIVQTTPAITPATARAPRTHHRLRG